MPDRTDQMLTLLRSIDTSLRRLVAAQETPSVASDTDLDSQYGNPQVKTIPKDWKGDDFKGCRFSECPPELLDLVAGLLDWQAMKSEEKDERTAADKPVAPYKRRDAARARGWAKRLRGGWTPPPMAFEDDPLAGAEKEPEFDPFGGDVPF